MIETVAVISIVFVAAGFLFARAKKTLRADHSPGGCSGCGEGCSCGVREAMKRRDRR